MSSTDLLRLSDFLTPGHVYRREDLQKLSSNVDRYLKSLVMTGVLEKLQHGLYLSPKTSEFGESFPDEKSLLESFLKDDHFVVYSPNAFNTLGLGMTQLYSEKVVFNRKRHGEFELCGRKYFFYRWREAPKKLSKEFLVVELLNRLPEMAENHNHLEEQLRLQVSSLNQPKFNYALMHYGTKSAQLRFQKLVRFDKKAM